MNLKIKFLLFLLPLFSFGQEYKEQNRIKIRIEILSSTADSLYKHNMNKLEKDGYKKNKKGEWFDSKGNQLFVSLPANLSPKGGILNFQKKLSEQIEASGFLLTRGSIIFNISEKGEVSDIHSSNDGNKDLQKFLSDFLKSNGRWSPGIFSGHPIASVNRLTVVIE